MFNTPFTCGVIYSRCANFANTKNLHPGVKVSHVSINFAALGPNCINYKITKSFSLRGRLIIVELLCNIRMYLCIMPVAQLGDVKWGGGHTFVLLREEQKENKSQRYRM